MSNNILKHESDIWKTADLLIGAGIKQSDFPKYMMPFFALIMVESRLIRELKRLKSELREVSKEDFVEMFQLEGLGYNDYTIRERKTLKTICQNDKTFDVDFYAYIRAFDPETRYLLGVDKGTDEEKFLDISGVAGLLKKKDILFDTVKAWSEIDLTPFNNSEITTLEEHIKRKWADISAETAGEQYTPEDIIALITEIISSKIDDNDKFLTIYDPTCGGANLLFGVEDKIQQKFNRPTKTHGDEWNDTLYALAKIESRFRNDSDINHGNTLTRIFHIEKKFDIVVANPPYGVDWKGYQKDIKNDTTERFVALPSISDGQFLFTQHILHHLADDGLSVVVHNGSTLFSGDAGSGESNIRKYFFEQDWVEAIIQMPTDEFFNTGIYTYLWVFNKNKSADRQDKLILIDGSDHWEQLKKSKGKKRRQMNQKHRNLIVDAFTAFKDNDFAKVFDKWSFYYNKQAIMLTNVDEDGKSIEMPTKTNRAGDTVEAKSIKLNPSKITYDLDGQTKELTQFTITSFYDDSCNNLKEYYDKVLKPQISAIDYKESNLKVVSDGISYYYDTDKNTVIENDGKETALGCGKINIKVSYKKATKTKGESISLTAELTKDIEKDYEIIPYSLYEVTNQQLIADFMAKYVSRPFVYLDKTIGVELNFNKVFYEAKKIESANTTIETISDLKTTYETLINPILSIPTVENNELIECDIALIPKIPMDWIKGRMKDIGSLFSGLSGKSGSDFNQDNNPHNKGFIPFTNIAANTYILKDDLGTVIVKPGESQNKVKIYDIFFLMSSEGYEDIGKSALLSDNISDDVYLNSFCKGFRLKSKNIDAKYLNYLLLSHDFREKIILEGKGFTRINLKMNKINDLEIYYPPTNDKQTSISTFIDDNIQAIDDCLKNIEHQVEQLNLLKRTLVNDAVNGKIKIVE